MALSPCVFTCLVPLYLPVSQYPPLLPCPTSAAVHGGLSIPRLPALRCPVGSPYFPTLCSLQRRKHVPSPILYHICTLCPLSPVPCRTPPSNHSLCLELLQSSLHRAQAKATREISQCPESSSHSDSSGRSTCLPANQLMQIGVRPPPTPTRGTIKGIHNPGSNHLKSSWSLQEHCEFLGGRNLSYSFLPVPCTVCWVCLRTST